MIEKRTATKAEMLDHFQGKVKHCKKVIKILEKPCRTDLGIEIGLWVRSLCMHSEALARLKKDPRGSDELIEFIFDSEKYVIEIN